MNQRPARTSEVWQWPEFQAFAKRLGIDTEARTLELTIRLPRPLPSGSAYVEIDHVTHGRDILPDGKST